MWLVAPLLDGFSSSQEVLFDSTGLQNGAGGVPGLQPLLGAGRASDQVMTARLGGLALTVVAG